MNVCEKTSISSNVYWGLVPSRKTHIFDTLKNSFFVITETTPKAAKPFSKQIQCAIFSSGQHSIHRDIDNPQPNTIEMCNHLKDSGSAMNPNHMRLLSGITALLISLVLPGATQAQFTYATNNGALTLTAYTGPGGAVTIPSNANGFPVTSIGNNAFFLTAVTAVNIPNSITNVGSAAFADCNGLTNIVIPGSVITIGAHAFETSGLARVTISSGVKSIGDYAFFSCYLAGAVTIPASVTNIGRSAFQDSPVTSLFFLGSAPAGGTFALNGGATVYYLPGTTNWGSTFGGVPTVSWNPQIQTSGNAFGIRTNRFGFNITGSSNLTVLVESATNLSNDSWVPISTNVLTGGSSYFSDPQWSNYPTQYYRIRPPN